MEKTKNRNTNIDLLKGLCIIFVILTHSSISMKTYEYFFQPFIINSAVPVFIFISAFVRSKKMASKGALNLKELYSYKDLTKQFVRLTFPFLFVFIVEEIIYYYNSDCSIKLILFDLLEGGHGPGSYYYPIMIQFILLFPFIFLLINKYKFNGLNIICIINIMYELLKYSLNISESVYRLLVFRYLFIIGCGVYYAINNKIRKNEYIYVIIGFVYIFLSQCKKIIIYPFTYWSSTSMIASLFWIPLINRCICSNNIRILSLEKLGRITYYVYLVQMFYFKFIYKIIVSSIKNELLMVIINLIVCIFGGMLFNYLIQSIYNKYEIS